MNMCSCYVIIIHVCTYGTFYDTIGQTKAFHEAHT